MGDEIITGHDFGFDKASFEIVVNSAGSFGSFGRKWNNPGFDFIFADGKERYTYPRSSFYPQESARDGPAQHSNPLPGRNRPANAI